MIKKTQDLIHPGQKAIVIFPNGGKFSFTQNGKRSIVDWWAGEEILQGVDKVVIYKRDQDVEHNLVYVCKYQDWSQSKEEGMMRSSAA